MLGVNELNVLLYTEINLLGLFILAIVRINQKSAPAASVRQKAFNALTVSLMITLFTDTCMVLLGKRPDALSRYANIVAAWLYYLFNCIVPYLWMVYLALFFEVKPETRKKYLLPLSIPMIVYTVLLVINLRVNLFYCIDDSGTYVRGPLFIVSMLFGYFYMVAALLLSLYYYRRAATRTQKHEYGIMSFILIMPFAGSLIQALYYGLPLIWICAALSLLMIFVNFQNRQISTDSLTGLNNRYQFDKYMQVLVDRTPDGALYSLIMLDIDHFKAINDNFGHVMGDKALITVADILKCALSNTRAFLSRYGGDEFAVVCEAQFTQDVIARVQTALATRNSENPGVCPLTLSMGAVDFAAGASEPIDQIIARADARMYEDKLRNHART